MTNIDRIRVTWTFPNGGPGVSTFYGTGAPLAADVKTFFNAIKTRIPTAVTLSYDGTYETIESTTGELQSIGTDGVAWTIVGTGTGVWAAGTGASVRWLTGGVVRGHRVFGRTFLAPLNTFSYDSDGTLDPNALTEFRTAAAALAASATSDLYIYTRPSAAGPGVVSQVTGSTVLDRVSGLRSRRV